MSAAQLAAAFVAGAQWAQDHSGATKWRISAVAVGTAAHTYGAEHAPKPKRKKATSSEAMSPGGAAFSKACKGAKSWESMQPEKLRGRVATICAQVEGKPAPPQPGAQFHFYYSPNPAWQSVIFGKMAQLVKLGVETITCETREEWESKQRTARKV